VEPLPLPEDDRYWLCPRCAEPVRGIAVSSVQRNDRRTINFHCPQCHHEWQHTAPVPRKGELPRSLSEE